MGAVRGVGGALDYKIGRYAKEIGLPVTTVRFYERIGLVRPQRRSPGGFRLYGAEDLALERFVGEARRCGLTLTDTALLLSLRSARNGKRDLGSALRLRLATIDAHLVRLRRSREILHGAARIHRNVSARSRAVHLDRLVGVAP